MKNRWLPVLLIIGICIIIGISPVRAADAPLFTFAVLPQMPPVAMHTNWSPFVERLARESAVAFELKLYESMDQFEGDIVRGAPDFVYLHSAQMVGAKIAQGYIPVVRNSRTVAGSFVVRKDSPIRSLQELEGKTVAFVGKKNLCRVLLHNVLEREYGLSVNSVYAGTAGNMLKHVILSKADAGGALDMSLEQLPPGLLNQVRILYTTQKIAPHALAAHPRVPARVRALVADGVLRMGSDSGCRLIMDTVQIESPVKANYALDYQALELSNIQRYFGAAE